MFVFCTKYCFRYTENRIAKRSLLFQQIAFLSSWLYASCSFLIVYSLQAQNTKSNDALIQGETVNLQKVNIPKNLFAQKSTALVGLFGRLTFCQLSISPNTEVLGKFTNLIIFLVLNKWHCQPPYFACLMGGLPVVSMFAVDGLARKY
jgi:hypothetical protein